VTCWEDGCLPWVDKGDGPCPGSMFNIILPGSPGIAVYQDHYGGHYRRKTVTHVMMLWKYKPIDQDGAL
jgi:hypothetical protein